MGGKRSYYEGGGGAWRAACTLQVVKLPLKRKPMLLREPVTSTPLPVLFCTNACVKPPLLSLGRCWCRVPGPNAPCRAWQPPWLSR